MNLLEEQIKSVALNMDYEKCGIIKISDMFDYEEKLNERIERIPEVKPYYQGFYRFAHLQDTYPWQNQSSSVQDNMGNIICLNT